MHQRRGTNGIASTTVVYSDSVDKKDQPSTTVSNPFRERPEAKHSMSRIFPDDMVVRLLMIMIFILVAIICACFVIIFELMDSLKTERLRTNQVTDNLVMMAPQQPLQLQETPSAMEQIGDKSEEYTMLRMSHDRDHPMDSVRSEKAVVSLHKYNVETFENPIYDIEDCPFNPPEGYPYEWNTLQLLENWKPDDTTPPSKIHQGLCIFDYQRDFAKAKNYREQELPFVVRGDPKVHDTVERWNTPGYMDKLMALEDEHIVAYSETNSFLYFKNPENAPPGWKNPTEEFYMTYAEWLEHANITDASKTGPDQPHWYFRLKSCGAKEDCEDGSEYLYDELAFFQPRKSFYIVEPERQKGIHCRFGMQGVKADNHFDGGRNYIVLLGGERRYILSHPNQCENMCLYPWGHPSARHSAVDWSNPDLEQFPAFESAKSNEVLMQAGDVLYLPTYWFHFIISLSLNFQCNSRSGFSDHYDEPIAECGY